MSDPAAGTWEAPGGHLEADESPRAAALREWQEECGLPVVDGEFVASWTSPDGVYMGFVYEIPREADLDIFARRVGSDPDGDVDGSESIAWWSPEDLPGNPAIRPELAASLPDVLAALGHSPDSGTVSKESVNYRPSQDPARRCGTCSMIRPAPDGYTCTLVQGAIDPAAVCDEWDPAGEGGVAKAADGRGPKAGAVRKATHDLSDGGANLTGIWRDIYGRRAKLLAKHQRAVAAAWDACMADLGSPRTVVREFRRQGGTVAKLADPRKPWWKDAGTATALAWLERLRDTKGWPALVAALEDAIRSGMAEGEAGALALAADRQGVRGFNIGKAFRAARQRLAGDERVAQQAQDAADGLIASAAKDAGRALADSAEDDGSEDDMTGAVDEATSGDQATDSGTDWWVYAAILGGALALYGQAGGEAEGEAAGPGEVQPPGTPPPTPVLLNWITAGDNRVCPTCSGYEDNSPYRPENVPDYPHPRCRCSVDLAPDSGFPSFLGALLDSFT